MTITRHAQPRNEGHDLEHLWRRLQDRAHTWVGLQRAGHRCCSCSAVSPAPSHIKGLPLWDAVASTSSSTPLVVAEVGGIATALFGHLASANGTCSGFSWKWSGNKENTRSENNGALESTRRGKKKDLCSSLSASRQPVAAPDNSLSLAVQTTSRRISPPCLHGPRHGQELLLLCFQIASYSSGGRPFLARADDHQQELLLVIYRGRSIRKMKM